MKILMILILLSTILFSDDILKVAHFDPVIVAPVWDVSSEGLRQFEDLWYNGSYFEDGISFVHMYGAMTSPYDRRPGLANKLSTNYTGIWDTILETTSNLEPENRYGLQNLSDNDISTAWVEGVKGNGIGEKIFFKLQFLSPINEFTIETDQLPLELSIINGYVKSSSLYLANSRVKELSLFTSTNDLIATFAVRDTAGEQIFRFEIPNHHITEKLHLEITDIYQGSKFEDLCITELRIYNLHRYDPRDYYLSYKNRTN